MSDGKLRVVVVLAPQLEGVSSVNEAHVLMLVHATVRDGDVHARV